MTFRLKLVLATTTVAAAVTVGTLVAMGRTVAGAYQRAFEARFESALASFGALEDARLATARTTCLRAARLVRLVAALGEGDPSLLYQIALDELRDVLQPPEGAATPRATFFRFADASGRVLAPDDPRAGLVADAGHAPWETRLGDVARAVTRLPDQQVGYLAPPIGGAPALQVVIVTRIVDPPSGRPLGALAIGFPAAAIEEGGTGDVEGIRRGIWLDGQLYATDIPASAQASLARLLREGAGETGGEPVVAELDAVLADGPRARSPGLFPGHTHAPERYRILTRRLHPGSPFPPAYRIALYSMAEATAQQRGLSRRVVGLGAAALALGLVLSLVLAHGLTVPVRALVAGTAEVQRGNLAARVPVRGGGEMARLAASFNAMTEELALKERYRSVLDLVADRQVARQLIDGGIALGGELREVTVLFCDVRDFSALTQRLDATAVVHVLNEHMTALTRVIHRYGGVVDKFVGDALMALFGAPHGTGDDAWRAACSAWDIVAERRRLNAGATPPIEVGVGIATGTVVAGCLGSTDRLNYTVIGERVNLAARLAAVAGRMEVLVDEATYTRLAGRITCVQLPARKLKGFAMPVAAFKLVDVRGEPRAATS